MSAPHSSRHRSPLRRAAAVAAALLATAAVFAPAAAATPVGVTYIELGPGFNEVWDGQDAGSYIFEIDGQRVEAYCADATITFNGEANFSLQPAVFSDIPGIGQAGWLAANAASVPTPLSDADAEAAAVQIAVWSFTNDAAIDATTVPYEPVRTRALALVAAVGTNTSTPGPVSFELALTGEVNGTEATFTATLTDDAGSPISSQPISFSAGDATGEVTTEDGTASWTTPAPAPGATLAATATFEGSVLAGSVIVPDDDSQPLVLADDVAVTRTATAEVATPAAGAAPTAPSTTAAPAPVAAPPAEELPYTGGTLGWPHLLAAAAVLTAAGFAAVRMRRGATT